MKIHRVNINNYKSMESSGDIFINENIFALIGQNNTGKSTVLDAIQCVFPDVKKSVDFKDFHNRSKDVIVEVEFINVSNEYIESKMLSTEIMNYNDALEKAKVAGKTQVDIEKIKSKWEEKIQKKLDDIHKKYEIQDERFIVRLIVPKSNESVGKKKTETRTAGNTISDADLRKLMPSMKVIPAIRNPQNESTAGTNSYMKDLIQMLDETMETSLEVGNKKISYAELNNILAEESNRRCDDLSKMISQKYSNAIGSNDFEIKITSEVNISKGTSFTTKLIDKTANLASDMMNCGTGYQSMIILSILQTYLELSNRKNGYILIIEEPEVYLHPNLQRKMIETLCRLSEDNQILFSTHSPITIAPLEKHQIALVVKENSKAHLEEIDVKKVIEELGVRASDILMKQGVILVEGPDDKNVINCLLEKISCGSSSKINVLETGSCSKIAFYANAQKLFNNTHNIPLLLIRDADCKSVEKQKEDLCAELKALIDETHGNVDEALENCIYIVGDHSLESLLINRHFIKSITNESEERCEAVCRIFLDGYNHAIECGYKDNVIAGRYQPKYFLEKKLDEYGYGDEKASLRQKWDDAYYRKWKETINELYPEDADEKYALFYSVREKLNEYTRSMAEKKQNYMTTYLAQLTKEDLFSNSFKQLSERLASFIDESKH